MDQFVNETQTCKCGYDLNNHRRAMSQRADDIVFNNIIYKPNIPKHCLACVEFIEYYLAMKISHHLMDMSQVEAEQRRSKFNIRYSVLKLIDELMDTWFNIEKITPYVDDIM
jgi:hypothetical protein